MFVGFDIHAPEYGWDDYKDIDVKGKIVIAMVNDPGYYDAKLFRERNMTNYGCWTYKLKEARRQGAAGCLVLHNTETAGYIVGTCVEMVIWKKSCPSIPLIPTLPTNMLIGEHLGIDNSDALGDSIYNGAYDNASGMAAADALKV